MTSVGGLEPGMVFGKDFRIVRALRAGGMGAVYVVEQLSTGKQRALKVMMPELAVDPSIRERFVLEAKAAGKIESDHVVEIVTAGVDEASGAPFLVMELLKGEELADALARTGRLSLGDVAEVLTQVGHALEQAHAQGIVHRDLKPENIFLAASKRRDASFTAKVLDFGIAKLVAESQKTGTQPLGTPLFMSPEQTDRKGRISPATDVWALGLITFKLLTGKDFWLEIDGSLPMLLREIVVDAIPPASERAAVLGVAELLPPGFDGWFAKCVHRDIDARFQDAGAASAAFAALVAPGTARGQLTVHGGTAPITAEPAAFGATAPVADAPRAAVVKSGPAGDVSPLGATTNASAAISAAAPVAPAPAPRGGSKAWLAIPAVLVLAGVGWFVVNPMAPPPIPSVPSAPRPVEASTGAAPATSAAAAVKKEGTTCPDGMALVKGGKMFMGARDLGDDAKPPHEVLVSTFCMDKTEVTTAAYDACFAEKHECERPLDNVSWPSITDAQKKRYSPLCNGGKSERGPHPINCVAWSMADNFCKKRGGRLPTEAEWEYAARGTGQRMYPWGDDPPTPKRLNGCGKECAKWGEANGDPKQTMYPDDDGFEATAPVGSFPGGASADGVLDLAGNVWEWTADWYAPYPSEAQSDPKGPAEGKARVVRGGDFASSRPEWAKPAWRWKTDPDTYNHAIGFRCATDAK